MSQDTKKLSRREGLQVAAGVLALGAGLGVTRIGEAQTARKAELADRVQMKWFLPGSDQSLKLVDTVTLPSKVIEAIYAGRGPRMRACVSTSGSIDECLDFLRIVLHRVGS